MTSTSSSASGRGENPCGHSQNACAFAPPWGMPIVTLHPKIRKWALQILKKLRKWTSQLLYRQQFRGTAVMRFSVRKYLDLSIFWNTVVLKIFLLKLTGGGHTDRACWKDLAGGKRAACLRLHSNGPGTLTLFWRQAGAHFYPAVRFTVMGSILIQQWVIAGKLGNSSP